ncbi:hypothetical protein GCK72_016658 [Caenorhabditis remanei]|uniref:Uncharacterized protein n=1 Tax=Caenorhabditis remanei TaxID=31234 RepID=A0A6A5G5W1_CAERE|nr:hypothetical protein GCK72_016658 [Caenorhabditis remanei]KAF1750112.1 hypothetical protein GCK72_016658 [Caenorhabditis remanei]
MDSGKLVEYCLPKLTDALLLFAVSLTLLQCCPPKKNPGPPPQMKYDARSPTITNSRSRSHSVSQSPGKSPMSPSPSKRSSASRASKKHRKSAEEADRKHKKKTKKKKKSAESGKKDEGSRRSSRRGSVEKDAVLPVQSTQPSLASSSDPDSVGTARIEMITFPIAESPAKKPPPPIPQFKKASHEPASAEKKSKEFPAVKKASQEILPAAGRRQSRETMRDPFAVQMKQSKECERANSTSGGRDVAKNF